MARFFVTKETFIERMSEKFPNSGYDYSNTEVFSIVNPNGRKTKIATFVCPVHGEQRGDPHNLFRYGCAKCSVEKGRDKVRNSTDEMENKLKDHFGISSIVLVWDDDSSQGSRRTVHICDENGKELLRGCFHDLMHKKWIKPSESRDKMKSDRMKELREKMALAGVRFVTEPDHMLMSNEKFKFYDRKGGITETTYTTQQSCGFKFAPRWKQGTIIPMIEEHANRENLTINSDYKHYKNQKDTLRLKCNVCGHEWTTTVGAFIHQPESGCASCKGKIMLGFDEFVIKAKKQHGDRYQYSNDGYQGNNKQVTIICPTHGPFKQIGYNHLKGCGCPYCNVGLPTSYKFNLLQEFENEYAFRAFLDNNDINILLVILRNVEPKYEPIKADIERALRNANEIDPIQSLEQKYSTESNEFEDISEANTNTGISTTVDLDDDNAVNLLLNETDTSENESYGTEPSIEDVIRNNEQELHVITRIEHLLTPEDREYIMEKFLNDKRRIWMANRDNG